VSQKQLLEKYVNAVLAAPSSLGLTATKNPGEFLERHVLDALKMLSLLPKNILETSQKVIDVGSGNGVPGIPIAIASPHWEVFLLDSNNKKCGFLDMFCKFNEIKNVHVVPGRAEVVAREESFREGFDIAFSRALDKLPAALELTIPFLKVGGILMIPHGGSHKMELARAQNALKELSSVHQETLPYQLNEKVSFTALTFIKQRSTSEKYPRKAGTPHKRPL
jgi:16S rRNA (guanine527-N7)-methyltransferase